MIKLKIFEQTKGMCGPASLRMVFDYYGLKLSEKELAQKSGASVSKGASPDDLIKAVKSSDWHGFFKEGGRLKELEYFVSRNMPVVVDWFSEYEGHYSVVTGVDRKFVYLADPEFGRINKIFRDRFLNVWFDFEGPYIRHSKKLHFGWMLVPSPEKLLKKFRGTYF